MSFAPAALVAAAQAKGDQTPADMARRMGVPYLAVYRWATGRNAPDRPASPRLSGRTDSPPLT